MHTRILHAEFPATGQPIRVILIDGDPWFAVADVCRILGRTDPTKAVRSLGADEYRVVNLREGSRSPNPGTQETAGRSGFSRGGNPNLDVVSESGLHRLIMRSGKALTRPLQDWVTRELLASIRRRDTGLGAARERMAPTFAEAMHFGTAPPIPEPEPEPEPVAMFELVGQTFQLYPDGSVHCRHGAMDSVFPTPDEDDGPPYGPRFRCTRVERGGSFDSRAFRPCPPVRLTDLARASFRPPRPEPTPAPPTCSILLIAGAPTDVLTVLNGVRWTMNTQLMHTEFTTTGQAIRVVIIDGEPWFAVPDVCRILGRSNPTMTTKLLDANEHRVVNLRGNTLIPNEGIPEGTGQHGISRGNPNLNVVNESGLYRLIMRSDKALARPFQDWVTRELLPSIRRGDTNVGAARERMAQTFAEALELGQPVVGSRRLDIDDQPFEVRDDGSVHCPHGRMRLIAPQTEDALEPPFGPYLLCAEVERVGIRRHKAHRPCQRLLFTSVVRHLRHRSHPPLPEADVVVSLGSAELRGRPAHIAEVLHRLGMTAPAY